MLEKSGGCSLEGSVVLMSTRDIAINIVNKWNLLKAWDYSMSDPIFRIRNDER